MTDRTPERGAVPGDGERTHPEFDGKGAIRPGDRGLLVRFGIGLAGLVVGTTPASAHEFGHGEGAVAFLVVLGLPTLAGFVGGVVAVRYRNHRSEPTDRGPSVTVGLLLAALGMATLVPGVTGHLGLTIVGGTFGAAVALWIAGHRSTGGSGCGNHPELTLGAISTHRLLEGVVLGTLYSAGAAVGLVGAVAIAGHTALETAAVGGVYATTPRRIRAAGAIILVQACYVAGAVAGLGVSDAIPASIRTFVLAVVGGTLLAVGALETERSVAVG